MTQIFPRWFDTVVRAGIVGMLLTVPAAAVGLAGFYRSDYVTAEHVPFRQPCRYCHQTTEDSAFAGLPPTETCMNCHQQIWVGADLLKPVRDSYQSGQPLVWQRVHRLPGFVYFHHGVHVAKGVGCAECHGRVDQMPLTWQDKPLTMGWCLDCHRNPAHHLRPRNEVFNMTWATDPAEGRRLFDEYHVRDAGTLTSCSTCHR